MTRYDGEVTVMSTDVESAESIARRLIKNMYGTGSIDINRIEER